MSIFKKILPQRLRSYLEITQNRISRLEALEPAVGELRATVASLETAIDTIVQSPSYVPSPDVGFNGQEGRKVIFRDLMSALGFDLIIETGTWIGNTTGYMAEASQLKVMSAELSRRFHSIARMRLGDRKNIILVNSDSRDFLRKLAVDSTVTEEFPFIYLDAHWYDDLPLNEEIAIIAQAWDRFVIMIDDFQVPQDSGYGHDDFGPGRSLTEDYIRPLIVKYELVAFYPSIQSENETGLRRGCVVLAKKGQVAEEIMKLHSLRAVGRSPISDELPRKGA